MLGKIRPSAGERNRESRAVRPIFSISFPPPDHRHTAPVMERANVTPAWAPSTAAADRAPPLPDRAAKRTLTSSIPVKIQLITMDIPPG